MAFLRRAERMLDERRAAPLDHSILLAAMAAGQSIRAGCPLPQAAAEGAMAEGDSIAEIVLAGPGWRRAVSAQRGSFSRAEAGRRVNGL
ncbi:hypothetical protein FRZ32_04495 [Sphingosinicella ginsenosidimutans]|uniref:Uncharacterized protein n=2 Tax=Allosphingosinicella ginsenosidimutans TaxID=1176539 RepID=A0A5C6TSJ3_9SPHN|nr:hypothetical protein FRZ32_04495 [Sphingosinicella ginsenosidimutans]